MPNLVPSGAPIQTSLQVGRALPATVPDQGFCSPRSDRYGDTAVTPFGNPYVNLADEGTYYVATNPTPGTAISYAVVTAELQTNPLLLINNTEAASVPIPLRIYLDYVRIICSVAPASATSAHMSMRLDIAGSNRFSSGGSILSPGLNVNGDLPLQDPTAKIYFGNITAAAASGSIRLLSRVVLRGAIPVVSDEWILKFGTIGGAGTGMITGGTSPQRMTIPMPPVVVGPGQWLAFSAWFPSNALTASQYEVEIGYWVR